MAGPDPGDNPTLRFIMELLGEHDGLCAGRMFGYPALYLADPEQTTATGKQKRHLLLSVTESGVAVRVGEAALEGLLDEPCHEPFAPYHMPPLKGWILIRRNRPEDYVVDLETLEQALGELPA